MSASDVIGSERMEALLRGDAPRTTGEERRAALLDGFRAAQLRAPEALRERVLGRASEPRPARFRLPSRRLVFVVVPAAAALAVGAALVHGFVGSGSHPSADRAAIVHGSVASVPAWKGATLNSGGSGAATGAPAYKLLPAPTGSATRLQHTAASLQVTVPDTDKLSQATAAATRIATSLGGYAQSVVYRTPQGGGGIAQLELRIPAANVKQALARLAALGTIVSQQVSVQDLQHAFAVQSAQIGQLRRSIAALALALRNPSLPDAQKVLLQIRLAEQKRALAQRLHARTGTVAAGTTARVSLVLSTKQSVVPVPAHRGRIGRMVHSAVGFLALEATVALYALIVVSPFVLLAGLVWGLNRARRRRDERRLLAA
jgi:Domain of unknown function (DUF4349)